MIKEANTMSKTNETPLSIKEYTIILRKAEVSNIRKNIEANVGDTTSIVGTLADGTGILIAMALADVVALNSATDFAKYKKAKMDALKALSGDADIVALASSALVKINKGEVVLTAHLKGLDNVITESLSRSTAVATILKAVAEKAPLQNQVVE